MIKYTDLELLNEKELGVLSCSNKYVKSICDDPSFWFNKITKNYDVHPQDVNKIKRFLEFKSYKKLYIYFSKLDKQTVEHSFQNIDKLNAHVERLNTAELEKYIDRKEFIKSFKRKLFEIYPLISIELSYDLIMDSYKSQMGNMIIKILY